MDVREIAIADLKPHSKNYVQHPPDQLEHIAASIRKNGFYRNIVIARDNTILAGHGVVKAAAEVLKLTHVPALFLDVDPMSARALKVLTGDNTISHLAEVNDRELAELLKQINDDDIDGLLGTGFDEMMLANLAFVTRPASEVESFDAAAEWVGMPDYERKSDPLRVTVCFESEDDRTAFMQLINATVINQKFKRAWTIWYPEKPKEKLIRKQFVESVDVPA